MAQPREVILKGERARALLNDELLVAAFNMAELRFIAQWRGAVVLEQREAAHARVSALAQVKEELTKVMDAGLTESRRQDAAAKRGQTGA